MLEVQKVVNNKPRIEEKNSKRYTVHPTGARSSVIPNTLEIPLYCLERIANVFAEGREGEHAYDAGEEKNYALGGDSFILDRLNHADAHLRKYAAGDRSEDHLAKIGWAVVVAMMWEKKKEASRSVETIEQRMADAAAGKDIGSTSDITYDDVMCSCGHPKIHHGVLGCAVCSKCKIQSPVDVYPVDQYKTENRCLCGGRGCNSCEPQGRG